MTNKASVIKIAYTLDMEGSGFHSVEIIRDEIGGQIIIKQDDEAIHLTLDGAAVLASILTGIG